MHHSVQAASVQPSRFNAQVIEPVRSRCLCIRVAAPTEEATVQMLKHVAAKENAPLPDELALRVAKVRPQP